MASPPPPPDIPSAGNAYPKLNMATASVDINAPVSSLFSANKRASTNTQTQVIYESSHASILSKQHRVDESDTDQPLLPEPAPAQPPAANNSVPSAPAPAQPSAANMSVPGDDTIEGSAWDAPPTNDDSSNGFNGPSPSDSAPKAKRPPPDCAILDTASALHNNPTYAKFISFKYGHSANAMNRGQWDEQTKAGFTSGHAAILTKQYRVDESEISTTWLVRDVNSVPQHQQDALTAAHAAAVGPDFRLMENLDTWFKSKGIQNPNKLQKLVR